MELPAFAYINQTERRVSMVNHIGTQEIRTGRLLLRKFREGDAGMMYRNYTSDSEVTRFLTWPTHPSEEVTNGFLQYVLGCYANENAYEWAVEFDGEIIGSISVVSLSLDDELCEIGYCYGKKWWGKGIGTEALNAVIKFLFESCNFNCISACHAKENPASGKVMLKCGMKYEGTLRARKKSKEGGYHDILYYSILKDEYQENK